jgi:hypothetical protein
MSQSRNKFITSLALVALVLVTACAALVGLSHHDASARATAAFPALHPVSISFSRVRMTPEHILSIYWRTRFTGPHKHMPGDVEVWQLRPFRSVDLTK